MYEVAIDVGKRMGYIVVAKDGNVISEGMTEMSKKGFDEYLSGLDNPMVVFEATGGLDRIAALLDDYTTDIRVAHPMKVRLITESVKKTDRNDAHTLLHLAHLDYLPPAYLPEKKIRNMRNICRSRDFLVRQRVAIKNKIHDQAYRLGIDIDSLNKKTISMIRDASVPLRILVDQLNSLNDDIGRIGQEISRLCIGDKNASFVDTIPGIGPYSALGITSEIGDVNRFPSVENLWAYAGLVPKIHQSGSTEWKGHITKGNRYLKYLLVEIVQIHINTCPESPVTAAFERVKERCGYKKARIAAARHLLRIIYCMLKEQRNYRP